MSEGSKERTEGTWKVVEGQRGCDVNCLLWFLIPANTEFKS